MKKSISLTLLLFLNFFGTVHAAGFLDHLDGAPYRWKNFPIHYKIDQGPLGAIPNPDQLVADALQVWANVSIADVSFTADGLMSTDVTASNYTQFITIDTTGSPRTVSADGTNTIVIFDTDGSIFDDLIAPGAHSFVLGIASPGKLVDSDLSITEGLAILNGTVNQAVLEATMTHEFGHMLNLSHTQVNADQINVDNSVIPTMFDTLGNSPADISTLNPDDEFSLGFLYPRSPDYENRGSILGKIVRRNGDGVRGVNVLCRKQSDPLFDIVSWISDAQLQGNGEYFCANLGTGLYEVLIEPLGRPINAFTPYPPYIATEFYNNANESFDPTIDDRAEEGGVTTTIGVPKTGVDIILNEDGRLISGQKVIGTTDTYFSPLEYFITVPPGASSLRLELKSDSPADLDIVGRCDTEFSIPVGGLTPDLVDQTSSQQAEIASTGPTANETITLDSNSNPPLQNCTYYLLIPNYSTSIVDPVSADFAFTATVSGGNPRLEIRRGGGAVVTDGTGDILVKSQKITAHDETFRLREVTFTDDGTNKLSGVTTAKLYEDVDQSGGLSAGDTLISTAASIDPATGRIRFLGFDEFFDPTVTRYFLVTYHVDSSSAGWGFFALVVLFGIGVGRIRKYRGTSLGLILIGTTLFFGSCGESKGGFAPHIASKSDVTAVGQTYGESVLITVDESVASVKEFFE